MANSNWSFLGPQGKFIGDTLNKGRGINPYGTLNPEQVALTQSLGPEINTRSTGDASQFQYGGQLNAPIGQGEQDVVNNAARLNAIAGNTYGQIGQYDPTTFNQQFDKQVVDPTFASYKRNVLPGLEEAVPGFSTARLNVAARGLQNVSDNLSTQRLGAQQAQQGIALNALQGGSNYNINAANIAAIPRVIQQAGLDKQYQNFIQANQQKSDSINQALQFLGISTVVDKPPVNPIDFALSAGKTAAQLYGASKGIPTGGGGGGGLSSSTPNYSLTGSQGPYGNAFGN